MTLVELVQTWKDMNNIRRTTNKFIKENKWDHKQISLKNKKRNKTTKKLIKEYEVERQHCIDYSQHLLDLSDSLLYSEDYIKINTQIQKDRGNSLFTIYKIYQTKINDLNSEVEYFVDRLIKDSSIRKQNTLYEMFSKSHKMLQEAYSK